MKARILIVEDETLVALNLENVLTDQGHQVLAIADDRATAMAVAQLKPDIALVDLNLRDGPTGAEIGRCLAGDHGVTVIYLTANPTVLGVDPRILGVLSKPCDDYTVARVVDYAMRRRVGEGSVTPPTPLKLVS